MIDWIATHPEDILHLCVIMVSLVCAAAGTYTAWWFITDELDRRKEHNKVMAEYRRNKRLVDDYMDQPLDQIPDEETDEVIRRII